MLVCSQFLQVQIHSCPRTLSHAVPSLDLLSSCFTWLIFQVSACTILSHHLFLHLCTKGPSHCFALQSLFLMFEVFLLLIIVIFTSQLTPGPHMAAYCWGLKFLIFNTQTGCRDACVTELSGWNRAQLVLVPLCSSQLCAVPELVRPSLS